MGRARRWLMAVVLLLGAASLGAQSSELPAVPVEVAAAKEQEMGQSQWIHATVVSRHDARLAAEIPGRLEWVAEVGDRIAAGQPVARLDDALLALLVQQDDIKIRRLEVNLDYLTREVERQQSLTDQQITARNQLDALEIRRQTALQDLEEAKVVRLQNQHRWTACRLLAPFDGQVVERLLQPGEYTNTGLPIVRLVDTEHTEARARAPLEVAPHVRPSQKVTVKDDRHQLESRIRTAVPVGDERSRMFEVRVELPPEPPWIIGAAVRLALPNTASRHATAVPRDALVLRQGETYIFTLQNDRAHRVDVEVGVGQGSWVEVTGDLAAGDPVVIRGAERLEDGQQVIVGGG